VKLLKEARSFSSIVKKDLQKISDTARQLVDSMSDMFGCKSQRDSLHDLIVKLKDSYNEFFSSIEFLSG